jgi:hypothetical protein
MAGSEGKASNHDSSFMTNEKGRRHYRQFVTVLPLGYGKNSRQRRRGRMRYLLQGNGAACG